MKQYKLAPFYQWGLLIGAMMVFGFGVVRGIVSITSIYGVPMANIHVEIATERGRPLGINTQELVTEFEGTRDTVRQLVASSISGTQTTAPAPTGFSVGRYAELSPRQIDKFKQYLTGVSAATDQLKTVLTHEFDKRISVLLDAAVAALPEKQPGTKSVTRPSVPHTYHAPQRYHLYTSDAIAEKQLNDLRQVARFLGSGIATYTPSKEPQQLAAEASKELSKLIKFLEDQVSSGHDEEISEPTQSLAFGETSPDTPKEALIKEFITKLTYCRESMHEVLLSKWRIDELVSESMKTLVAFQRDKDEKIRLLDEKLGLLEVKGREEIIRSVMIFTICTVVTFLLLMIRDFMTAVVGVAMDMSKLMSRIEPGPPDA